MLRRGLHPEGLYPQPLAGHHNGVLRFLGWLKEEPYFTLWAEALPQPDLRKESALSVLPLTWPMKLVWGFL